MSFEYRALSVFWGRIAAALRVDRSAVASGDRQARSAVSPPAIRRVPGRKASRFGGVSGARPVNGLSNGSSLNSPGWASLPAQQPLGRGFLGMARHAD
jgi:hypothetical protein